MTIARIEAGPRMAQAVVSSGLVFISGQVGSGATVTEQTKDILQKIDELLEQAKSSRSHILNANIWLADISDFTAMNDVWDSWDEVTRAATEPPPMMTRDKVTAYIENSKQQFETDLTYYLENASSISRGSGIHRIYSHEILVADSKRVVLRIDFIYWFHGKRPESMEFLLNWQGDKLVFVSHQGI